MSPRLLRALVLGAALGAALGAHATAPEPDPVEVRAHALASQLRCLVCQNQTIADSNAPLALDLKAQVRQQLAQGKRDDEVIAYMTARYGDFVLYKPPFKATTALLWVGPPLLMLGALLALFFTLRARQRAAPDAFDQIVQRAALGGLCYR